MSDEFKFSSDYQILMLSEALQNPQFSMLLRDSVTAEMLSDRAIQWFFDTITNAPTSLTKQTLKEELFQAGKDKKIRTEELDRYKEVFKRIVKPPTSSETAHLKNSLSNFVRAQSMKTAIVDAFEMLQTGKFDDAVNSITAAANKGVDLLSAGHDYYGEFQQRLDERDLADDDRRLPTGIVEVDEILGGGLKNKQFGLVVGSTGTGKTVLLSWLAKIAAQFYNKTVFYFTLELPERDISERFDSMVTHTKPRDLKNERAGVEAELSALAPKYKNKLYIKEFIPGSTPVSAFVTYYKNMAAQGIVADLVIIDYLDLIKAHTKYNNLNQDMDAICIALCGFAKDCDTRIWSATQMNRSGMVSDNPNEANIAGAIDKLFSVDVAVFMAQSKEEREYQEMRLSFIKNRNGPAGKSVKLETDYGYMTFYKKSIAKDEQRNDEDSSTSDEEGGQAVQLLREDA